MDPVIRATGLTRQFGRFVAVNNLNMEVLPGEIYGFLGANGSGKTTTVRMLCGLLAPSAGTATVSGWDVGKHPEKVKRQIGYVSQAFSLYTELTVTENLEFFSRLYRVPQRLARERAEEILEMTKLSNYTKRLAGSLSGGMKQKLALACAYVHDPQLYFLDEPTAGIDPLSRRELWSLLHELARRQKTIFVTTHYIDEAEQCHRVGLMHLSRLVLQGKPAELRLTVNGLRIMVVTSPNSIRTAEILRTLPVVQSLQIFGGETVHVRLAGDLPPADALQEIQEALSSANIGAFAIEEVQPSLEDLVIYVIEREGR